MYRFKCPYKDCRFGTNRKSHYETHVAKVHGLTTDMPGGPIRTKKERSHNQLMKSPNDLVDTMFHNTEQHMNLSAYSAPSMTLPTYPELFPNATEQHLPSAQNLLKNEPLSPTIVSSVSFDNENNLSHDEAIQDMSSVYLEHSQFNCKRQSDSLVQDVSDDMMKNTKNLCYEETDETISSLSQSPSQNSHLITPVTIEPVYQNGDQQTDPTLENSLSEYLDSTPAVVVHTGENNYHQDEISPVKTKFSKTDTDYTKNIIDSLVSKGKIYRCEHCNVLYPEYSMYLLHAGIHSSNTDPFQCHFCQKSFINKYEFMSHFIQCLH